MPDTLNPVNAEQTAVVGGQDKDVNASTVGAVTDNAQQAAAPTATAPQSKEDNAKFASLRRENETLKEADAKTKRALDALRKAYGFDEADPETLLQRIQANAEGSSLEEVQKRERERVNEYKKWRDTDPDVLALKRDAEEGKRARTEKVFSADLAAIKAEVPDANITSVTELGDKFMQLRAMGFDAVTSYRALAPKKTDKPVPPDTGAVSGAAKEEKDYYTSSELDKLTKAQLDDPKIMEKAMKSLTRLKGK